MPVMNEEQLRISSLSARKTALERKCSALERANEALVGELASLKKELDKLKKAQSSFFHRSVKRAKKLEAIRMILDSEWVLDTRRSGKKIVKAEDLRYKVN